MHCNFKSNKMKVKLGWIESRNNSRLKVKFLKTDHFVVTVWYNDHIKWDIRTKKNEICWCFFLPFSFGKWRSPLQRIRNNVEKGTVGKREIETIDNDQKGYGAVSLIHYVHWLKKNRLISNSYCIETKHKHTAVLSHHWCLHEHQIQFHSISFHLFLDANDKGPCIDPYA